MDRYPRPSGFVGFGGPGARLQAKPDLKHPKTHLQRAFDQNKENLKFLNFLKAQIDVEGSQLQLHLDAEDS